MIVNTISGCVDEGDVPPPGVGVVTEMSAVPGFSISEDGMIASSSPVLMKNTVGSGIVPAEVVQFTVVCCTKFFPSTFRVNCGLFASMFVGLSEMSVGWG